MVRPGEALSQRTVLSNDDQLASAILEEVGQVRVRWEFQVFLPANPYRVESIFGSVLTLTQHTNEIVFMHHHDQAGQAFSPRCINLPQAGAIRRRA